MKNEAIVGVFKLIQSIAFGVCVWRSLALCTRTMYYSTCVFELCIRTMLSILLPFVLLRCFPLRLLPASRSIFHHNFSSFFFVFVCLFVIDALLKHSIYALCVCVCTSHCIRRIFLFLLLFLVTIWDPDVFCRLCSRINETYVIMIIEHVNTFNRMTSNDSQSFIFIFIFLLLSRNNTIDEMPTKTFITKNET